MPLLEQNELAWSLYWRARLPGALPQLLTALSSETMAVCEADALAFKVEHLASVVAEIEEEKRRLEMERAKNANR